MTAALLWGLLAAASVPQGPVAVMPFKNLNADPALDWLRRGMAETMVSDLKQAGKVSVVEREQIDKALAEVALQGGDGTEEHGAVRVGKLLGAKTIVVGSFQESGKDLRINARFVTVETGEVCGVAKATGPTHGVFLLQDQIISELLGVTPKTLPKAHARKSGAGTFKAYKLYAMALTTASDADKVGYLKQALDVDPSFSYAADELEALRQRVRELGEKSELAFRATALSTEASIDDPSSSPQERGQKAVMALGKLISTFHYARAKKLAARVVDMELPAASGMDPTEMAHFYLFLSEQQLKEIDLALKTGEKFLQRYPTSSYFSSVQMQMQVLLNQRQDGAKGAAEMDAAMAGLEAEHAKDRTRFKTPEAQELGERTYAFRKCSELRRLKQERRAIDACNAFVDQWGPNTRNGTRELVLNARWFVALSWAEVGDFDKARAAAKRLIDEEPEFARQHALETMANTWPRE